MSFLKNNIQRLKDRGIQLARNGQYNEAIEQLKKALEIEPENGDLHFNLGLTYANCQNVKDSVEEFSMAIRYSPNYPDSYFGIATGYFSVGSNWKAAIFYLAFLDLVRYGEKSQIARTRLSELGTSALTFDIQNWLIKAKKEQYDVIIQNYGNYVVNKLLVEKPGTQLTPDLKKQINQYVTESMTKRIMEFAAHHFSNGLEFFQQEKYRACIAQLFVGLDNWPENHSAICVLAHAYASAGEYDFATVIINLVDVSKVEIENREEIFRNVEYVKKLVRFHS